MLNDGIVAAIKTSSIDEFLRKLETESIQITSGPLEYFLNVLIEHDQNGLIFISQKTYAERIRQFSMESTKLVSTSIKKGIEGNNRR